MNVPTLPDPVRRFLLTSVPSVPHLEAMLLLRAENDRPWHPEGVASRLYIREAHAAKLLGDLEEIRVARRTPQGDFVYDPPHDLMVLLDSVAACHARDLLGVTDLIHSHTERSAQHFADAFLLNKRR